MNTSVPRDSEHAGPVTRRERVVFSTGMLIAGALALVGARREVTHHDGGLLVVLPAALMPVWAAILARRVARRRP